MTSFALKNKAKPLALCLIAGVALSACGNQRMVRGYIFDRELAEAIQPGVDNRQSVQSTLGTPTVPSAFDDNVWYYVSTTVRVRPVFWPDAKAHWVMAVAFNDKGVVSDVTNYDLSDTRKVNPVDDITPTRGRHMTLFQQIFGSIGRVGAGPGTGQDQSGGSRRSPNG